MAEALMRRFQTVERQRRGGGSPINARMLPFLWRRAIPKSALESPSPPSITQAENEAFCVLRPSGRLPTICADILCSTASHGHLRRTSGFQPASSAATGQCPEPLERINTVTLFHPRFHFITEQSRVMTSFNRSNGPLATAFFGSLLLSLIALHFNPILPRDSIFYLDIASALVTEESSTATEYYSCPWISVAIAAA